MRDMMILGERWLCFCCVLETTMMVPMQLRMTKRGRQPQLHWQTSAHAFWQWPTARTRPTPTSPTRTVLLYVASVTRHSSGCRYVADASLLRVTLSLIEIGGPVVFTSIFGIVIVFVQEKQELQGQVAKTEPAVLSTEEIKKKQDVVARVCNPVVTKPAPAPPKVEEPKPMDTDAAAEEPAAEAAQGEAGEAQEEEEAMAE